MTFAQFVGDVASEAGFSFSVIDDGGIQLSVSFGGREIPIVVQEKGRSDNAEWVVEFSAVRLMIDSEVSAALTSKPARRNAQTVDAFWALAPHPSGAEVLVVFARLRSGDLQPSRFRAIMDALTRECEFDKTLFRQASTPPIVQLPPPYVRGQPSPDVQSRFLRTVRALTNDFGWKSSLRDDGRLFLGFDQKEVPVHVYIRIAGALPNGDPVIEFSAPAAVLNVDPEDRDANRALADILRRNSQNKFVFWGLDEVDDELIVRGFQHVPLSGASDRLVWNAVKSLVEDCREMMIDLGIATEPSSTIAQHEDRSDAPPIRRVMLEEKRRDYMVQKDLLEAVETQKHSVKVQIDRSVDDAPWAEQPRMRKESEQLGRELEELDRQIQVLWKAIHHIDAQLGTSGD